MKKVFLIAALSAISFAGFSQTSKGTWLVGGDVGFSSSKYGEAKMTQIAVLPEAGYFVINNLVVGMAVKVSTATSNSGASGAADLKSSSAYFGPYVQYYFASLGKNAKLYGSGIFAFGSSKQGSNASVQETGWGFSAGPAFFLNKNVSLEIGIGYTTAKLKGDTESSNSFGIQGGFQIHL